jgi:hypothetical protein
MEDVIMEDNFTILNADGTSDIPMPPPEPYVEPNFPPMEGEPVDEELLDQDTSEIDGYVNLVMREWESMGRNNTSLLGSLAIKTCSADTDLCASKLGVSI